MEDSRKIFVDSSWGSQASGTVVFTEDTTVLNSGIKALYNDYSYVPPPLHSCKLGANNGVGNSSVDYFVAQIAKACAEISRRSNDVTTDFDCPVCLQRNADTKVMLCEHYFHSKCFMRWFRVNKTCPMCRTVVTDVQPAPISLQETMPLSCDDLNNFMSYSEIFEGLPNDSGVDDMLAVEEMQCDAFEPIDTNEGCPDPDKPFSADDQLMSILDDPMFSAQAMEIEKVEVNVPFDTEPVPLPLSISSNIQFTPATTHPDYWDLLRNGFASGATVHSKDRSSRERMKSSGRDLDGVKLPGYSSKILNPTRVFSCRCNGDCRNARCSCVKEGSVCGPSCKCTGCNNPFLFLGRGGFDSKRLHADPCFMHNLAKMRDIQATMDHVVDVECCKSKVRLEECIYGYQCQSCGKEYTLSWCTTKLCDNQKYPRNHCESCRRCTDHRDVHCNNCGHCYFAGVSSSFECPCTKKNVKPQDEGETEDGCNIM